LAKFPHVLKIKAASFWWSMERFVSAAVMVFPCWRCLHFVVQSYSWVLAADIG